MASDATYISLLIDTKRNSLLRVSVWFGFAGYINFDKEIAKKFHVNLQLVGLLWLGLQGAASGRQLLDYSFHF